MAECSRGQKSNVLYVAACTVVNISNGQDRSSLKTLSDDVSTLINSFQTRASRWVDCNVIRQLIFCLLYANCMAS